MKNRQTTSKGRIASLLLTLALLLSVIGVLPVSATADPTVWDGTHPSADASAAFSGGAGTESNPYRLSTAADLAQLAANVAGGNAYSGIYFKLTADIDCNNIEGWKPIGGNNTANAAANPFSGIFDGDLHVIKNINIYKGWYIGFFGFAKNATIQNLGIESGTVFSNNSVVGGLCGAADNCLIENCFNKASVTCERNGGTMRVGGLCGITSNNTKLLNCYNAGEVLGKTSSTKQWTGGLVGYMGGGLAFEAKNCYNIGRVKAMGSASAGGIAGSMDGNAYAEGCFNLGEVSVEAAAGTADVWVGSLVGNVLKVSNAMLDSGYVKAEGQNPFGVFPSGYLEANYTATETDLSEIPTVIGTSFLTKGADYEEPAGATLRAAQETAPVNGKQAVRFVGTVDALDAYSAVGCDVTVAADGGAGTSAEHRSKVVYSSIYLKSNGEYTKLCLASQLGGSYLFTVTLPEVSAVGTVVFTVTPFTVDRAGVKTVASATYTVTYTNGSFISAVRA